jgi:MFS family permease
MDGNLTLALIIGAVVVIGGLMFYFWPTLRARDVRHPDFTSIFIINALLGWLLVPWAICLAWAYRYKPTETKACPYCAETILLDAVKCKHCRSPI